MEQTIARSAILLQLRHRDSRASGRCPLRQVDFQVNCDDLLNKFHMTHRNTSDRGFEISSLVNLEKRPHSLSVSPNLFTCLRDIRC